MVAPFPPDADKLAALREALPAVGAGLYFDTPTAGPFPAETAAAMADVEAWEVRTGRAGRDRRDEVLGRIDEARAAVAVFLGADLDDVRLCHGLGDAVARAIRTIDWRRGDRALVAPELVQTVEPLLPAGVPMHALSADGEAREAGPGSAARLLAASLVSPVTGARLAPDVATEAREGGTTVLLDVTQVAGTAPLDREALGADILVARSEAWLLGPEGLAMIAADAAAVERAAAPDDPFHLPSVVGLARSCGWLAMYVGLEWIAARSAALAAKTADGLRAIAGVRLAADPGGPVVVFGIDGWPADAVLDELGGRIFLLASRVPGTETIRIGTAFFNTEAEVDRLVDGVRLLASHRPDTLPPRR
ncbi:MAG TPA: aminotransferase class V-fold PLP-dependent enzyme, partial [Candidatus Limnocylindrales bacterium]